MAQYMAWGVLIASVLLIMIMMFRNTLASRWIGKWCLNVAAAIFALYVVNVFSGYTHFELPINVVTVAVLAILGVPGLLLLIALKLWVF